MQVDEVAQMEGQIDWMLYNVLPGVIMARVIVGKQDQKAFMLDFYGVSAFESVARPELRCHEIVAAQHTTVPAKYDIGMQGCSASFSAEESSVTELDEIIDMSNKGTSRMELATGVDELLRSALLAERMLYDPIAGQMIIRFKEDAECGKNHYCLSFTGITELRSDRADEAETSGGRLNMLCVTSADRKYGYEISVQGLKVCVFGNEATVSKDP